MPELTLVAPTSILDILTNTGLAASPQGGPGSKSEVRRLVQQGGVRLDGEKVEDFTLEVVPDREHILQIGRRKFLKLRAA
jgi:tyrosyl-tRNA synthetase